MKYIPIIFLSTAIITLSLRIINIEKNLLLINNTIDNIQKPINNDFKVINNKKKQNVIQYHIHYLESDTDSPILNEIPQYINKIDEDIDLYCYINNIQISKILIKANFANIK